MVDIQVKKTEIAFEFTIVNGKEEIEKNDPKFIARRLIVEYEKFIDFEDIWGPGALNKEVPNLLGLGNLKYRFVDEFGKEI
ncbi:hypothetical protein [Brevibacillus gelatini]